MLEKFEATGALFVGLRQLLGDATCKVRPLAIPGCRIVLTASSLEIDVDEADETIAILLPEFGAMFRKILTEFSIEAGANCNVVPIHQFDVSRQAVS